MKNLYILLLGVTLGLTPRSVMAQCDDFDPQTFTHTVDRADDPATLVQENWDWRNAAAVNWQAYLLIDMSGTVATINLPWPWGGGNLQSYPNVTHLNNGYLPDHQPSDGWELGDEIFAPPSDQ